MAIPLKNECTVIRKSRLTKSNFFMHSADLPSRTFQICTVTKILNNMTAACFYFLKVLLLFLNVLLIIKEAANCKDLKNQNYPKLSIT
jgi:hypothetical protein